MKTLVLLIELTLSTPGHAPLSQQHVTVATMQECQEMTESLNYNERIGVVDFGHDTFNAYYCEEVKS